MATSINPETHIRPKAIHNWLRTVQVSFVPGPMDATLEVFIERLITYFQQMGHRYHETPVDGTDLIITTAPYGVNLPWRKALLFNARRQYHLSYLPTILTVMHISPQEFQNQLRVLEKALAKENPDPQEYQFDGLAPNAYRVLHEQGRRGGAILGLERLIQAQAKSIRTLLVVGEEAPERVYHFDLVGGHPASVFVKEPSFYGDIVQRIVTTLSTHEITDHQVIGESVPYEQWQSLSAPGAMREAARELGKRHFFTDMVRIADLVHVPAVEDAVSSQYSEGCFATWEPQLDALISTVTGSAKPVDKGSITEDDLAVIVGVRPDGQGAMVRHVADKNNHPPSSEAVELYGMDQNLPRIRLTPEWGTPAEVPAMRSKLHGHRGISAYNPALVEYVPLDPPFFDYPVTCATEAQASGIIQAFSRSQAFNNPDDPRQLAFTVLPTHGIVIAEKWVAGKKPFQLMWEYMDAGHIQIDTYVPQSQVAYASDASGRMILQTESES